MQVPLQITFRGMEPSEALEAAIRKRAEKLERFYDHIISCRVAVERRHRHHHKGNLYHVRVDVTVPHGEIVASRDPGKDHSHEDAYVAIRDAFDAVRRQLEDYARRQRGEVKVHEGPPQGRIAELEPERGTGWIETPDGREVFFHRNALLNATYDELRVGMPVRFSEQEGSDGPRATAVRVLEE